MSFLNDTKVIYSHFGCLSTYMFGANTLSTQPLAGLRLLVLEDEFLIAMDVEQICSDHGAEEVIICKTLSEANSISGDYDAAIIDLTLNGESTIPFAAELQNRDLPFIFASGYTDREDIATDFPTIAMVGKPYSGEELVKALLAALSRKLSVDR